MMNIVAIHCNRYYAQKSKTWIYLKPTYAENTCQREKLRITILRKQGIVTCTTENITERK